MHHFEPDFPNLNPGAPLPAPRSCPPLRSGAFALLGLLAACGGGTSIAAGKGPGKPDDEAPPLVRVEPLRQMEVQRVVRTTGYLEAEHTVMVRPEVSGRLLEVLVDDGTPVRRGETVLVKLDDREAKAAKEQLDVQLKAAEVDGKSRELAVRSAEREQRKAEIDRDKAKAEFERNSQIAKGIISGKTLDEARFAWESAEEAVVVAEFNLETAKLEVQRAQNTIEELRARLVEAQLRIDRHTILAPLTGVVSKRFVFGGETVSSTTDLVEVLDPNSLVAYLSQPQRNLGVVRDARTVEFETDTWPDETFTADVERTSVAVDRETGSFTLRMRVREGDVERLLPGMFFEARILSGDLRTAWMLPKRALLSEGDLWVVFALRGDVVHEISVEPGLDRTEWVECVDFEESGLTAEDLLVVSGNDDLRDQQEVRRATDAPGTAEGNGEGEAQTGRDGER